MVRDPVQSVTLPSPIQSPPLRVGLIGTGTVGAGVVQVLARNHDLIAARAGRSLQLVMACARNLERAATVVGTDLALTNDPLHLATHPDVDVVVEAVGGTEDARRWALAAIGAGKHVVTANKALLAEHGNEIFAAAHARGVVVAFEGAVAVSLPVLKVLREGLAANRVQWLAGIVNGTTNFILSHMRESGQSFDEALELAQTTGMAEADPALDIDGVDAAHKLALLAAIAFGMPVRLADVQVDGIRHVQRHDMVCAEQLGYRIKLMAVAQRQAAGVELRVQPVLVPATQMMAQVQGSMNGIVIQSDAAGTTQLYCAGGSAEPTASAVIADLIDIARAPQAPIAAQVPALGVHAHALDNSLPVVPRAAVRTRHYLRVPVHAASSIENVGAWFAGQQVPVLQVALASEKHLPPGSGPQVLVITDVVAQSSIDLAAAALAAHPAISGPVVTLRVEMLQAESA